jgi:hypothetical protein
MPEYHKLNQCLAQLTAEIERSISPELPGLH